jgi:ubiquinone/menaquinone biosynthesis C-methylase UbiE
MCNRQHKEAVPLLKKKGVYYYLDGHGKIRKYKPWLYDMFSFQYDRIMAKYIFPKKFDASIEHHFAILRNEFSTIHNWNVLEIATGSGNAVNFLPNNNLYTGVDISAGLLQRAVKRFNQHGFTNSEFYVTDSCKNHFRSNYFDFAFCLLSINFFEALDSFILELKRVLKPGATFFCCVPIPERKKIRVKIRGTLLSEYQWKELLKRYNFSFESLHYENGALLYFKAKSME